MLAPQSQNNEFISNYRIYYEDTDSQGVVYYANYLKFYERARTDFLRSKNIWQSKLISEFNIIFVVRKCQIEYILPAKLDDLVKVKTKIIKIGITSISLQQEMLRAEDDRLLNSAMIEIVAINKDSLRPIKISDQLRQQLQF